MPSETLHTDIQTLLSQGKSKEEIYTDLITKGWKVDALNEQFTGVKGELSQPQAQKKTISIVVTIGAILVGAGIFSFIASNWDAMSRPLKLALIIISLLLVDLIGWYLEEQKGLKKTGESLIFLGSLIYGGGIFLVGQMFHLRTNWPDGFLLWMIGVLAVAVVRRSTMQFLLALVLGFVAVFSYPSVLFAVFGANVFITTSSVLLAIVTVVTFCAGVVLRKREGEKNNSVVL